jgi:hypothetical protein
LDNSPGIYPTLGWSPEVQARVNAHLHGKGARLTEVVHDAGIGMMWVRTWEDGDRKLERKLKNRHSPQLCLICCGQPVQMPLMCWMPAFVPEVDDAMPDDDQHLDLPADQLTFDDHALDLRWRVEADIVDDQDRAWFAAQGIDTAVEAREYEDDQLDREDWSRGLW